MSEQASETVTAEVIESIERSAEVYGLSRSAGRVYGTLYFATEPLSIPELVDETGYAKSTISTATRKLVHLGMIYRRSARGGGRRVTFEAERDVWFVIRDVFQQYVKREMTTSIRTLEQALEAGQSLDETESAVLMERLEALIETYERYHYLLELVIEYDPEELIRALESYESSRDGSKRRP